MKEHWTDFEKYVFQKLEKIDHRLNRLEIKAAGFGALGALVIAALKNLWHS